MSLNYNNRLSILVFLGILLASCSQNPKKEGCNRKVIIQNCLNILSDKFKANKRITIISNDIANEKVRLFWLKHPVEYERNDLKDIRTLTESGKVFFVVTKLKCDEEIKKVSIVCINANLGFEFEQHRLRDGTESLEIVQEIDDALPFR